MLQQFSYVVSVAATFTCAFLFLLYIILSLKKNSDGEMYYGELSFAALYTLFTCISVALFSIFLSGLGMVRGW